MKLTKDEALAYLDRLITAKEIIEETHQVGDDRILHIACDYGYSDPAIFVHRLDLLAEIAGYELTVEDWHRPEYKRISFEHNGRTFCDLKWVGK